MKEIKVSVIIPAYNEEKSIGRIIKDVDQIFSDNYKNYEIIIVDDASTDNTLKICDGLKKNYEKVRVYSNAKNLGKTKTVLKGFRLTDADIISFIDADYQYDPKDLVNVIAGVKSGLDICSGNRKKRHDALYRKILSIGFNLFNRIMFNIRIKDVNCGLKAFKKGVMDKINLKYVNAPWFIDTEVLTRAYNQKMKVGQVDIRHYHRETGKSKINTLSIVTETIYHGVLLKFDMIMNKKS